MASVVEKALLAAVEGNTKLGYDAYKVISQKSKGDNILLCPLSVETILALTYMGANGLTAEEMAKTLHIPNDKELVSKGFGKLADSLKSKSVSIRIANKVFVKEEVKLAEKFKDIAVNSFDSESENIDVKDEKKALELINSWVAKKTENKIGSILDELTPDTMMVLVNAVYFNGRWDKPFKLQPDPMDFYVDKKTKVKVPSLHRKGTYKYYEDTTLNAQIVEIPYLGKDYSLIIVLPRDIEGLPALEEKFPINFDNLHHAEVDLTIPKFKLETTIQFGGILNQLGMSNAFSDSADFSGLTEAKVPLKISKVIQKCFIDVNEEGTEAAAATADISKMAVYSGSVFTGRTTSEYDGNTDRSFKVSNSEVTSKSWPKLTFTDKSLNVTQNFSFTEISVEDRNVINTTKVTPDSILDHDFNLSSMIISPAEKHNYFTSIKVDLTSEPVSYTRNSIEKCVNSVPAERYLVLIQNDKNSVEKKIVTIDVNSGVRDLSNNTNSIENTVDSIQNDNNSIENNVTTFDANSVKSDFSNNTNPIEKSADLVQNNKNSSEENVIIRKSIQNSENSIEKKVVTFETNSGVDGTYVKRKSYFSPVTSDLLDVSGVDLDVSNVEKELNEVVLEVSAIFNEEYLNQGKLYLEETKSVHDLSVDLISGDKSLIGQQKLKRPNPNELLTADNLETMPTVNSNRASTSSENENTTAKY